MVDRAIKALQDFGATRRTARTLLVMWAHYDSLSPEAIKQILKAF